MPLKTSPEDFTDKAVLGSVVVDEVDVVEVEDEGAGNLKEIT
jgi:hypothetical protein